jgi:hypothetical protein
MEHAACTINIHGDGDRASIDLHLSEEAWNQFNITGIEADSVPEENTYWKKIKLGSVEVTIFKP